MANDKCRNCGGDQGIHHYQTEQCPVGGVESPVGREQEWKTSTFMADTIPAARLASDLAVREYFAGLAMQGICAMGGNDEQNVAEMAVAQADALIEALNAVRCPDCKRLNADGHYDEQNNICPDYERTMSERG